MLRSSQVPCKSKVAWFCTEVNALTLALRGTRVTERRRLGDAESFRSTLTSAAHLARPLHRLPPQLADFTFADAQLSGVCFRLAQCPASCASINWYTGLERAAPPDSTPWYPGR